MIKWIVNDKENIATMTQRHKVKKGIFRQLRKIKIGTGFSHINKFILNKTVKCIKKFNINLDK
jgi:hypothetical protein